MKAILYPSIFLLFTGISLSATEEKSPSSPEPKAQVSKKAPVASPENVTPRKKLLKGEVVAVTSRTLKIQTTQEQITLYHHQKTECQIQGKKSGVSKLKPGDSVSIKVSYTEKGSPVADLIEASPSKSKVKKESKKLSPKKE